MPRPPYPQSSEAITGPVGLPGHRDCIGPSCRLAGGTRVRCTCQGRLALTPILHTVADVTAPATRACFPRGTPNRELFPGLPGKDALKNILGLSMCRRPLGQGWQERPLKGPADMLCFSFQGLKRQSTSEGSGVTVPSLQIGTFDCLRHIANWVSPQHRRLLIPPPSCLPVCGLLHLCSRQCQLFSCSCHNLGVS